MKNKAKAPRFAPVGPRKSAEIRNQPKITQCQYTHTSRFRQYCEDPTRYQRDVRSLMTDAYLMAQDWPSQIRYSYFVGSNGKLLCRVEKGGAK